MAALEVTLVRSWAGAPKRHRATLEGLGLYKIDDRRVLPDTEATLGMIAQVAHLVRYEQTSKEYKPTGRRSIARRSRQKAPSQDQRTS